ncbi:MAG TPA: heavy metal-responsive transcriptional regulator [Desulfuromonadales bacterium]|nr:heavy metal-responsive transcriptional regulator [Desulfuromonadales bacterium]
MPKLTIGKLAAETGHAVETLRYYERRGLIVPEQRTPSGYRLYQPNTARRLHFIRRAKDLGFCLEEIAELLSLSDQPEKRAAEVKALVRSKIADIDTRIRDLQRMREGLAAIDGLCHGTGSTAECPILAALNSEEAPFTTLATERSEG